LALGTGTNGADAGNYTLIQPTLASVTIAKASLTVTATADTKTYNGNTASTATPTVTAGQVFSGDTLQTLTQAFNGQNVVGTTLVTPNIVTVSDSNSGANYNVTLATAAGSITTKTLTVSGTVANGTTYNGTTMASLTSGTLLGVVTGETVTLTQAGTYASPNAGLQNITATDSLGGTTAVLSNYTLTQPTALSATIAKAPLTVTGTVANSTAYNGTTAASLSGGTLVGVVGSENVTLTQAGTYASANAGNAVGISATDSLGGTANLSNYILMQATGLSANITPAVLTATVEAPSKTYDGTTKATPTLTITSGLVGSETVTATGTATFNNPNAGMATLVTVNSDTLANGTHGGLASNYSLAPGQTVEASITPDLPQSANILPVQTAYSAPTPPVALPVNSPTASAQSSNSGAANSDVSSAGNAGNGGGAGANAAQPSGGTGTSKQAAPTVYTQLAIGGQSGVIVIDGGVKLP